MKTSHLTPEKITEFLSSQTLSTPYNYYPPGFVTGHISPAAVLITLLKKADKWHILYIRRTAIEGDMHSGQVAFPGGRCDPKDNGPIDAALREAHEEIGLMPKDVKILGRLNSFITISNYQVTPIIGLTPWPYDLQLSPIEVARAFTIPLDWLANKQNHYNQYRSLPDGEQFPIIYFKEYDGEILWGASARFTIEFLMRIDLL